MGGKCETEILVDDGRLLKKCSDGSSHHDTERGTGKQGMVDHNRQGKNIESSCGKCCEREGLGHH